MPQRISVAVSQETGPPERESVGVTCTLEFDEEPSSQSHDINGFQRNVHAALAACCRAVHDELRRQRQGHRAVGGFRHGAAGLEGEP